MVVFDKKTIHRWQFDDDKLPFLNGPPFNPNPFGYATIVNCQGHPFLPIMWCISEKYTDHFGSFWFMLLVIHCFMNKCGLNNNCRSAFKAYTKAILQNREPQYTQNDCFRIQQFIFILSYFISNYLLKGFNRNNVSRTIWRCL